MKLYLFIGIFILLGCTHDLEHERYVRNSSNDTILVFNPDFEDTTFTLYPGNTAMIYSYSVLDTKQESEPCYWMGDTLIIKSIHDSICSRSPKIEANWSFSIETGKKKKRKQYCIFEVFPEDFE